MGIKYVDSDSGNNANAGTSLAAAWGDIKYAYDNATTNDIILLSGTTEDTSWDAPSSKLTLSSKILTFMLNTDEQSTNYKVSLSAGNTSGVLEMTNFQSWYGIDWNCKSTVNFSGDFMEMDTNGGQSFVGCKWTATSLNATTLECQFINGSSISRDFGFNFFDCEFDFNGTACRMHNQSASYFEDCSFHGHRNTGTSSSDAMFSLYEHNVFNRCKFYDNQSKNLFYMFNDDYNSLIYISFCSFYWDDYSATNTAVFGGNLPNEGNSQNIVFHSNIFENANTNDIYLLEDETVPAGWDANGPQAITGPLCGKNVFKGMDTTGYTPNSTFSDTVSTTSNYESVTEGNADFLKLASGADAIGHSLYSNLDAGWSQSAGGGGGSGETNLDYILTTAPTLAGNINPNTVLDTNTQGTLDSANVLVSAGGDYVEPQQNFYSPNGAGYGDGGLTSGTQDLPALSSIDPADTLEGAVGTLDLPALNKVAPSDTLKGANGTMDLPAIDKVSPNDTLEGVTGTQDLPDLANVRDNDTLEGAAGTYSPDFPDVANVAPDDTVDGVAGTMDLPAIDKVSPNDTLRGVTGTQDLPALNKVAPDDTLEGASGTMDLPNISSVDPADTLEGVNGTLDLPALNKVAPTDTLKGVAGTMDLPEIGNVRDNDTLEGVTGGFTPDFPERENVAPDDTVNGLSGTMDLPDLDKVSPNDTLRGSTGTQDLPSLNKVAPTDTLEGASGTMDLPSINKVAPSDTLEGVTGTMDLPDITNVRDNDTLEGVDGEFTPDFPEAANVTADDTTNGVTGLIPLSAVKADEGGTLPLNKIAPSQGGTYLGDESNDAITADQLESGVSVNNLGNTINGTNKGENFNTVLTADKIKIGESITNLGNVILGTYDASERYTDVPLGKVELDYEWRYNSLTNNRTGTMTGSTTPPIPTNKVIDGYDYIDSEGSKTGTAGAINETDLDVASQIQANMQTLLGDTLPTGYSVMRYLIEPEKNDFYNNAKQYGVMIDEDEQDLEQTNFGEDVMDLTFEIVLTNDWINTDESDLGAREAFRELKTRMETIRRKVRETRAGSYNDGKLNHPISWSTSAPEYDFDDKIVILRAFMTLKYRV